MSKSVSIKILLLLLLAVTMACRKEVDTPSPAPQIQTVHYKASVQTEADTRATLGDGLKYAFETGDRIYMESEDGKLYGFLSLSSEGGTGKSTALFEGDLNYVGEEPFQNNNPAVSLVLVSRNDELHTITDGKLAPVESGSYRSDKWAPTLEDAVSRLSHFTGSGNYNDMRFTLQQQSSFLKCFVRMYKDQAAQGRTMSVKLINNEALLREAGITVSTAGTVPFVFAFLGDAVSLENAILRLEWVEPGIGNQSKDFDVSGKKLAANNYYSISRSTLDFDGFRIRAISNNTTITFNYNYTNDGIEYSLDFGETWTHYTAPFDLNADDVACIRGNRSNYKNAGTDQWETPSSKAIFVASSKCYIGGNIMSLLSDEETLSESAFQGAFSRGGTTITYIDIDPDVPLVLPVTKMADKCYMQMFRNCTSLTRAPQFRVESTAYRCCYNMFRKCSGLKDVSGIELPAMTLSVDCYRELFRECSNLAVGAPVLPAPTLVQECYKQMFSDAKVTSITCLATDISAPNCLENWVSNIKTGNGTFYKAPGMTSWTTGASGIPSGWTVVDYE